VYASTPCRTEPDGRRRAKSTIFKGETMKNPLDSLWGTVICGLILTAILYAAARALLH
jgi:hypothetical protein